MTKTNKELISRQREITATLANCKDEEREALEREYALNKQTIETNNQEAIAREHAPKHKGTPADMLREAVSEARKGGKKDITLNREVLQFNPGSGDNYLEDRAVPLNIKDVIDPAELPSIYNAVGIQIETGVRGQIEWPCLDTKLTVAKRGEAVALADSDLDFSAIVATPIRLGVSVAVTNEAIDNASFDLQGKVQTEINKALGRVIDTAMFSKTAWDSAFYGPFADANIAQKKFAATYPTYAELLAMKGKVLGTGVDMTGFAYIMNATTYATLEATPKTTGAGVFVIENGRIAGYPVYVVPATYLADGQVGAGSFGYVALNQHGDAHLIVDPYTNSLKNEVVFTLNADWSMTVLKYNAFVFGASTVSTDADATAEHKKSK